MNTASLHLCVVGVNHSTTPIEFREKLAISSSQLGDALLSLHSYVSQGVILSTCNRTEVYTMAGDDHQAGIDFLKAHTNISDADLLPYIYVYEEEKAIEHLFRVASGLDSMIIGEFEILGQVSRALEAAEKVQMVDLPLRNLFRNAIRTGRRVRNETLISKNALSVSSVAVDLATRVVGDLSKCKILVIGAGEAGRLVAKAARERSARQIAVTARSEERAATLAAVLGGRLAPLSALKRELSTSDVVISCTGAPHPLLGLPLVKEAMETRPELPLVIIDIAVPRDVEPAVAQLSNVYLFNIDHLNQISNSNRGLREKETHRAMKIIQAEVAKFSWWWRALEVKPTVSALVRKGERIRQKQLRLALKRLGGLSQEERDALEAMTKAIVQKLLHEPIQCLKRNAHDKEDYTRLVSELFGLDGDELK